MTKDEHPPAPLTRESMYALVWSEPMLKVAARYDVSSSYMARVCSLMNVPRPERGYWAMLAAGKKPPIPPLPDPQPGNQMTWSRGGQDINVARPLPRPPSGAQKRRLKPKAERPSQHPLVYGVKDLFETGRFTHETGYLKPDKKLLVDLVVTKPGLDKALSFANHLFLSFEDRGYRVVLEPRGENFYRAAVDEHEVPRKNRDDHYCNRVDGHRDGGGGGGPLRRREIHSRAGLHPAQAEPVWEQLHLDDKARLSHRPALLAGLFALSESSLGQSLARNKDA
jgi:hypothetical protein